MIYDFDNSWKIGFGGFRNQYVAGFRQGLVKCISCGLSVPEIIFKGTIKVVLETREIKSADVTASMSSVIDLIVGIEAQGPSSGSWKYTLSGTPLKDISVANVFAISPKIINSLGIDYTTGSAVDVVGGASMSLNNAAVRMDMVAKTARDIINWHPQSTLTYPSFKSTSKVRLASFMQTSIEMSISISNAKLQGLATLTSETTVGFDSEQLGAASGSCATESLLMTSYVSSKNTVMISDTQKGLAEKKEYNPPKCFKVPSNKPSNAEVASLREVGGEFCTSYNRYNALTSTNFLVSTTTAPSTTTETQTETIVHVSASTTYLTEQTMFTVTSVVPSTHWILTPGTQQLETHFKKRDVPAATVNSLVRHPHSPPAVTAPAFAKRAVATPAMVAGWEPTKISYACSQITTGTITTSVYQSTSTVYSGVSTVFSTRTVGVQGPLVTQSVTYTVPQYTTTTVTEGVVTSTRAISCPLQTQVSCFTITGHGAPHIEGKPLGMKDGDGNPRFDINIAEPGVFYLTTNGTLVGYQTPSNPGSTERVALCGSRDIKWIMTMKLWALDAYPSYQRAVCSRDCTTKTLTCTNAVDGSNAMNVYKNADDDYDSWYGYVDDREWTPRWGTDEGTWFRTVYPVQLRWEEAECPCQY